MSAIIKSAPRKLLVASFVAALCGRPAYAQIASGGDTILFRTDAAGVRTEPQYQGKPLTIGPAQATVALSARLVADSNIFRTSKSANDDIYLEVAPSVRIAAGFGAHSATLSARASTRRHARFSSEDRSVIDVNYAGRIDLGPQSAASFRTAFVRESEQRGSVGGNRLGSGPAIVQRYESSWSASTEFGRMGLSVLAGIAQRSHNPLDLANGTAISQSFRDTKTVRVAPRLNVRAGPSATIFVGGSASRTRSIDRSQGALRDASGYTLLAGVRSDAEGLIVGEVGIGWRGQNYRNTAFRDFTGLTYDATVDWYPTRLVSLRVQAGQDIVNSNFASVAGIVRRYAGATFYYDPLRNLRFVAVIEREHDDFRELKLSTSTTSTGLTARYQIGRHVDFSVFGRVISKTSSNILFVDRYNSAAAGIALTGTL